MRPLLSHVVAIGIAALSVGPRVSVRHDSGVIRGQVIAVDPGPPAERPRIGELSSRHPDPVDRRRSVVYLESATVRAFEDLKPGRVKLDQRGQQFVPRVLAITVGTIVDLPNNDTTFHNAFSLAQVKPFDLGRYPPGRSRSVRFDRPGRVPVFCDIHSHMSAYILVFSHPFFAVTDDQGNYTIAGVPAGTYSLAIWSELGEAPSRPITVADGDVIAAPFQIGRGKS